MLNNKDCSHFTSRFDARVRAKVDWLARHVVIEQRFA
jgi:hypothetical protein